MSLLPEARCITLPPSCLAKGVFLSNPSKHAQMRNLEVVCLSS